MTPPFSRDVVALADMMISQDQGAFLYPQKAILDKSVKVQLLDAASVLVQRFLSN